MMRDNQIDYLLFVFGLIGAVVEIVDGWCHQLMRSQNERYHRYVVAHLSWVVK